MPITKIDSYFFYKFYRGFFIICVNKYILYKYFFIRAGLVKELVQ